MSYAQMVTGLKDIYDFTLDSTHMYFHETIRGTRVSEGQDGFEMNLFHRAGCG